MTQKELLYYEDAIGHESNIEKICRETLNNLQDERLVNFMENQLECHKMINKSLKEKLGEKANG